jgi:hypothetical protein
MWLLQRDCMSAALGEQQSQQQQLQQQVLLPCSSGMCRHGLLHKQQ